MTLTRSILHPATLALSATLVGCGREPDDRPTGEGGADGAPPIVQLADWKPVTEGLQTRPLAAGAALEAKRFTRLDPEQTGISFHNQLDRENIKNYLLSGAGLTVGDVDGNGLPDLFLVSQDGPNKLFLQHSPWRFVDATESSGIRDTGAWGGGAAFADIDNDGDLDLYVCNKGAHDEIYLNSGDGTFRGGSVATGDPSERAPTMVAFADYDGDGDLDFYRTATRLLSMRETIGSQVLMVKDSAGNWQPHPQHRGEFEVIDGVPRELGTFDRLFRNEGIAPGGMPKLVEVTGPAGIITAREHGLAAVWWDFDNDRWPDLYVSNDFHTPDHLYRNNRDGTFSEVTREALPYTSWSSMGSDFADLNNDGWFDYLSTDMSATTHFKQKTMMGAMTDTAWFLDNLEPRQYMRNALQVNTGTGKFIDLAFYAGLDSTDWTWAALLGDLDNDGLVDAFFTNGIERNVQDSDLNIRMNEAKDAGAGEEELREMFLAAPRLTEANVAFRNLGEFRFENVGEDWGLGDETVSHGAVLADLDRDGDLDLVVNNMNDPLGVYRNDGGGKAVLVSLKGTLSNHFGLGARVVAELPAGTQLTRMVTSSRGYMSGTEAVAHFGLGQSDTIQKLRIEWPSGHTQEFADLAANQHYLITEPGGEAIVPEPAPVPTTLLTAVPDRAGIDFEHHENYFNDFDAQPLLPNRMSRLGPALAAGDADGDGDTDLFFGGAADREAALFIAENGRYQRSSSPALAADLVHEDVAATWFDADADGDLDLFVVSGGASHPPGDPAYVDRLYFNDGDGGLSRAPEGTLPDFTVSGSCAAPCDFDGDGDTDLFVGGRFVPGHYPTPPQSALLVNDGDRFTALTEPFADAGMVTGAAWADFDGDERPDLALATEWGPVRIYKNTPEGLSEAGDASRIAMHTGWWTCVVAGDIDGDGDNDLLAGNFGLNTKYSASPKKPATLFAADFGARGELQLVEAQHKEGRLLPVRGRSCSTTAMPHLLERAPSYSAFASKTLRELYTPQAIEGALRLEATTLVSTLFRNDGGGGFTAEPLPLLAQVSPVMAIGLSDFDADGHLDAVLAQNFNAAQRETGRMNAGLGTFLRGAENGDFSAVWPRESGLSQRIDSRGIALVSPGREHPSLLVIAANQSRPVVYRTQPEPVESPASKTSRKNSSTERAEIP